MRNCTRDEGGPFEVDNQVLISSHRKLLSSRAMVVICRRIDNAMVKAIARAFRWRDMLESGDYATIREIASAEKINETTCQGDPGGTAAGGAAVGSPDEAVPSWVAGATSGGSAPLCLARLRQVATATIMFR